MTYRELQQMDPDAYADRMLEDLWEVVDDSKLPFYFLEESEGHGDIHYAGTEDELLKRVLHSNISAASCFPSPEEARSSIAFGMIDQIDQIKSWFFMNKWECGDEKEFRRKTITMDMRGGADIGYGIGADLQKYRTGALTIVLERDFRANSPYGIKMITAYPELTHMPKCAERIGEPLKIAEIVDKRDIFDNNIDKLAVFQKYQRPELNVFYGTNKYDEPLMGYHHATSKGNIDIYIKEDGYRIFQRESGANRRLTMAEYTFQYPKEAKTLADILSDKECIDRGQSLEQKYKTQSKGMELT